MHNVNLAYDKNIILKDIADKINNMSDMTIDTHTNEDATAQNENQEKLMVNLKRISNMNSNADSAITSMQRHDCNANKQVALRLHSLLSACRNVTFVSNTGDRN